MLHDTAEFSWRRENPEAIVATVRANSGKDTVRRPRLHTVCGLLLHDSLAVTTDGLPLGLTAAKFWSRKKFKGADALKKTINLARVPIEEKESMHWLEGVRRSTELLGSPDCESASNRDPLWNRRQALGFADLFYKMPGFQSAPIGTPLFFKNMTSIHHLA